ncbi:hypothetical protein GCM10027569_92560 [Flindersiella endophytica]
MLAQALGTEVQLEPDPVALTARVGSGHVDLGANGRGAAEQASRALAGAGGAGKSAAGRAVTGI